MTALDFPGRLEVARALKLTPEARVRLMEAVDSMVDDDAREVPEDEIWITPAVSLYLRELATKGHFSVEQAAFASSMSEREFRHLILEDEVDEPAMRAVVWVGGQVALEELLTEGDVVSAREYRCSACGGTFTCEEWHAQHGMEGSTGDCDTFDCRCAVLHERCS